MNSGFFVEIPPNWETCGSSVNESEFQRAAFVIQCKTRQMYQGGLKTLPIINLEHS
jgi:hypothetical protein